MERETFRLFRDFVDGYAKGMRNAGQREPETDVAYQAGLALFRWNEQHSQESDCGRAQRDVIRTLDEAGWTDIENQWTAEAVPDGIIGTCDYDVVRLPGISGEYYLCAAPSVGDETEAFWRAVYDSKVERIYFVEDFDPASNVFLPYVAGVKCSYGTIRVLCKSASNSYQHGYESKLLIWSVVTGSSEFHTVVLRQCRFWPETVQRDSSAYPLTFDHPIAFAKLLATERKTMVVCETGRGNSCVLLLLHAAMTSIRSGDPVSIRRLLRAVRRNRPGAVQSSEQWLVIAQLLIYNIKKESKPDSTVYRTCNSLLMELIEHEEDKSDGEDEEKEDEEEGDDSMEGNGDSTGEASGEGEIEEETEDEEEEGESGEDEEISSDDEEDGEDSETDV